ncbi:rhomboid family intramembrane serine protease [Bacillus sp. FJAT-44742]|uniref:rhomboid family intramembrane serine protease n=1 Tax=Bacillus sp. FJAT-44742 TaxID=2014005 RepID=UPI000C23C78D|nr:rhomboid family intramembrane serine protease [Bacillus sp. FJAT-44742]
MFRRHETFYTFRRDYPVITGIIAIHLIIFLLINPLTRSIFPLGELVYWLGIGFNPWVAAGEYWRLVTPIFMHVGVGHLLFNSFALALFAPALEQMLGKIRFISVYLLTGILANVATFFIGGLGYNFHLGASGAIFGLFGLYAYMVFMRKDLIDSVNSQIILVIVVIGVIMTFLNPGINIYAHIFGLLSGIVIAPLFLGKARPFYAAPRKTYQDTEVTFNPNRWKKRRFLTRQKVLNFIGLLFIILVIIGVLGQLF